MASKATFRKSKFKREDKLAVVFDEESRKEFITGFHKRKLERRKVAQEKAERKAKQMVLEQRKHKREAMQQRLAEARRAKDIALGNNSGSVFGDEEGNENANEHGEDSGLADGEIEVNADMVGGFMKKKEIVKQKTEGTKVTTTVITTFDPFGDVLSSSKSKGTSASASSAAPLTSSSQPNQKAHSTHTKSDPSSDLEKSILGNPKAKAQIPLTKKQPYRKRKVTYDPYTDE